jgi:hypothetical protein
VSVMRAAILLAAVPSLALAQRPVEGMVYDSLLKAPLRGADVWLRGTPRHTETDANGRFELDSIAPGRYMLLVSHPGLDSAGLFTLAVPVTISWHDSLPLLVATPSLATLWRRRCGEELEARSDSGLVFGVVEDAKTQAHLAGAGVLLEWIRLRQIDAKVVQTQPRQLTVRTDSTGAFYACGVATDMKIGLRAYAQHDSSGLIDLQLGPRAIGRQDLTVALAPERQPALLKGQAVTTEETPVWGGRVTVREGAATVINDDGTFTIRGVAPGTQWITVQAIGRAPTGMAVDLRPGDSVWVPVTMAALPVMLAPVRVVGAPERMRTAFEERARNGNGLGYYRTEADVADMPSMRTVLSTVPSMQLVKGSGNTDFIALLPAPSAAGNGWCVPGLYIDGALGDWQQVQTMHPKDLVGVEVYPRPASVPLQYQQVATGCGVVLIWTKYVR